MTPKERGARLMALYQALGLDDDAEPDWTNIGRPSGWRGQGTLICRECKRFKEADPCRECSPYQGEVVQAVHICQKHRDLEEIEELEAFRLPDLSQKFKDEKLAMFLTGDLTNVRKILG